MDNKLNDLKPLLSRKKSFTPPKRSKKMLLHWKANLVSRTIHDLSVRNKPSSKGSMLSSQAFYPNMEDRSCASSNEFCSNHRMNIA